MSDFIPVNEPVLSEDSKRFVNQALDSGWISSSGSFVKEFEEKFASYIGMKYGTAVSSGTAALHVALLSLGIGPGDEVIVPAFTMGATWLAVLYTGAKPVFVDCELETFNIDVKQIEAKITKKTKAIIPVHIYGHACEMDSVVKVAKKNKITVLEDAAEACGGEYRKRKCGSLGKINAFSFYANKIITTGEGGMVVTDDEELAKKAGQFKDLHHSLTKRFVHSEIGYNYRLTNLQAALGCGELMHVKEYLLKKRYMAEMYNLILKDIPGLRLPETKAGVKNVYWMYGVLVDPIKFGMTKDELRIKLKEKGVDTRDFFYPPNQQPVLRKYLKAGDKFPNCELAAKRGMYLPSGLALTDRQMMAVADALKDLSVKKNAFPPSSNY
jgi:perosamine synthetase